MTAPTCENPAVDADLDVLADLTRAVREAEAEFHRAATERALTAAKLHRRGLTLTQIAERMGMHTSHAHRLVSRGRLLGDVTPPKFEIAADRRSTGGEEFDQ